MEEQKKPHLLLVTYPIQGHINPGLQFAKRLLQAGARVTWATSSSAQRCLGKATILSGLAIITISDAENNGDVIEYFPKYKQQGVKALAELFEKSAVEGNQFTCVIYTGLLQWAAEVARGFNVPNALLWAQPATVFDIHYYYFNGYKDFTSNCEKDPSWSLELPNLPLELKARDLPTFILDPFHTFLPSFEGQMEDLAKEEKPRILVNTFDTLEPDALRSIERLQLISIGPLIPSAFLDGRDPSDKSFGGDLFQRPKDDHYLEWLDSQEESSVIYVSFGSLSALSQPQMEELGRGLLMTHRPFLWVIRVSNEDNQEKEVEQQLSFVEELKEQGLIVPWCSQVEVLFHPSIGCFVTHCGWNSTQESLTSGVPMVAFPQWADQMTNAKLVEDVWKIGARVKVSEEGFVKGEEIMRCLEIVMESEEIRKNAKKWSDLAVQAAKEGGSSDNNLKAFVSEFVDHRHVNCK